MNGPIFPTQALARTAADWLAPLLAGKTALSATSVPTIMPHAVTICCRGRCASGSTPRRRPILPHPPAPALPIDYEAEEGPKLSIRVQELFGLARHPSIAGGRVPL